MNVGARLDAQLREAITYFWNTRDLQGKKQGLLTGTKDAGTRSAVTGGAQMDGFVRLVRDLLSRNGVEDTQVYCDTSLELPGWYRPEKKWDLLVVSKKQLIAAVEFKSHVGPSFGNNYNNRTEEAVGSATDVLAAYREGAFKLSAQPWLGHLMLLEDSPRSTRPVRSREPHFEVFPEFKNASYSKRYELLLTKLVRERLYDAACFLMSDAQGGRKGLYSEPSPELTFRVFVTSLLAKAIAVSEMTE